MLRLHVKAPFAAFRRFAAGPYRPTAPLPVPTTIYGLLLHIAAIETRRDDGRSPMTVTAQGLPGCEMAMGLAAPPQVHSLLQQLHNYPVGKDVGEKARTSGKTPVEEAFGNKYNVQPVRRELLSQLDMTVCVRGNTALEDRVRTGLREGTPFRPEGRPRYGVPFMGDNNLIVSHLAEDLEETPVRWVERFRGEGGQQNAVVRLPIWIDRASMAQTRSDLFMLSDVSASAPPPEAWVRIEPPEAGAS